MIELRWLQRRGQVFTLQRADGELLNGYAPGPMVLQYRERGRGTVPGMIEPDWSDVPTVTEDL